MASTHTIDGIKFSRRGRQTARGTEWYWVTDPSQDEIIAGTMPRRATAAETRKLNRMAADAPSAMSLPGVHPSYRV